MLFLITFRLSQLIFLIASLIVGGRLLLLARRTRKLPELLIGLRFFSGLGIGVPLAIIGIVAMQPVAPDAPANPELQLRSIAPWFFGIGHVFIDIGLTSWMLFTYVVFRRGVVWARWLLAFCVCGTWVGLAGFGWTTGFADVGGGPWYWVRIAFIEVGTVWGIVEAFRYYRMMRKRLAFGLADAMVTDRFHLWAWGSTCNLALSFLGLTPALLETFGAEPSTAAIVGTFNYLAGALVGLAGASLYWLTFFPPHIYRRHVERRTARFLATEASASENSAG